MLFRASLTGALNLVPLILLGKLYESGLLCLGVITVAGELVQLTCWPQLQVSILSQFCTAVAFLLRIHTPAPVLSH